MMRVKSISQILRYYFSNQPKSIQKPDPIEFNFKLPKKQNLSQSQQDNEIKITTAKRNDVLKVIKKKKENEEYKNNIEEAYQTNYQKKIQENNKTAAYHQEQYFKGQRLLENIPLDPYYSYKLADFARKVELEKNKFKQFIGPVVDYEIKAHSKMRIADLYHEKQQKYQVEQFLRYLDEYPGSPKGPLPEDDLSYFIQYAYKKIPAIILEQIAATNALKKKKIKTNANNLNDLEYYKLPQQGTFTDFMAGNRPLSPQLIKDYKAEDQLDKISKLPVYKDYEEIPQLPELQFNDYQQWMKDMTNWDNFKNHYVKKNALEDMIKQLEYMNKVYEENDPDPENQYFTFKAASPSLLRYYKTLPKQVQQHPGVKNVYLGLEFYCNYYSYEKKQQGLNMAAAMAQPLDKVSLRAMQDFIAKKKEYMTPFMVDKIFTINPEFTWDINEFFAQIKRQQLKGQSMIKENEASYAEPPQVHLEWEEGTANLPVDFYDNDDGFWDEIISEKLKRQDQAKPIMRTRKHFLH